MRWIRSRQYVDELLDSAILALWSKRGYLKHLVMWQIKAAGVNRSVRGIFVSHTNHLWRQSLRFLPHAVFIQMVDEAVVHTVFTTLPELHGMEFDPEAAPEGRERDLA